VLGEFLEFVGAWHWLFIPASAKDPQRPDIDFAPCILPV
jgi:hypothetical protein